MDARRRRLAPALVRALALMVPVLLAACGAGGRGGDSATDAEALFRIEPPEDPAAVAISVGPDGKVDLLRGLTEADREAGRRYPSRSVSPARAENVTVIADADPPWSALQAALGQANQRGASTVRLDVVRAGAPALGVTFRTGGGRATEDVRRQRLLLRLWREAQVPILQAELSGGAWLVAHGCPDGATAPDGRGVVASPAAVADAVDLALSVVDRDPGRVDVRLEAGARPGATEATVGDVAEVLAALGRLGLSHVDLGLRGAAEDRYTQGEVEEGLRWLAAHACGDGGWDADGWAGWCDGERMPGEEAGDFAASPDVGVTGLALAAFLGAGYTNRGRHPFAMVVSKGLRFLKRSQRPDGTFATADARFASRDQGLATLALVMAYGMTGSPIFRGAATGALSALPGVWRESSTDTLATGYVVLAVQAARVVADDAAQRGRDSPWTLDEGFLRALHVACRVLADGAATLDVAVGITGCLFQGDDPDDATWREIVTAAAGGEVQRLDPLAAWFHTLAAWRLRGTAREAWSQAWKPDRRPAPRDGHKCCLGGSWDEPEGVVLPGGRVEATALRLVPMQVYYRYDAVVR